MQIEFDPKKARINPLNHEGVTFDEAKVVLLDPYALTREDTDSSDEARFVTLGMGAKNRILVVVWTLREARATRQLRDRLLNDIDETRRTHG